MGTGSRRTRQNQDGCGESVGHATTATRSANATVPAQRSVDTLITADKTSTGDKEHRWGVYPTCADRRDDGTLRAHVSFATKCARR